MNTDRLAELFDDHKDEFLEFGRVPPERRLSNRPDLHGFCLLDKLVPGERDMVCNSQHDVFYLDVSPAELAKWATEEQVIDLIRCGLIYEEGEDSLAMYT